MVPVFGLLLISACAARGGEAGVPPPAPAAPSAAPGPVTVGAPAVGPAVPRGPLPIPVVAPAGTLALVESWPVETTLDHPDIPDAADAWVRLIDGARSSLDIEQFYVSTEPGSRLEAVLDAVERAAGRGVSVRLVADAKYAKTYPETLDALDAHPRIEVRRLDLGPLTGGVQHAKFFIVDGKVAFMGSQNFDWRSLTHIQELGLTVDAPAVVDAWARVFALDWALAGGVPLPEALAQAGPASPPVAVPVRWGDALVRVQAVASPTGLLPDGVPWDWPHLRDAIAGATERVRLQALSYEVVGYDKVEWRELDDALRAAAARGVAVELIVADWSKSGNKLESVQALARVPGIAVRFVRIPEASTGFVPYARVVHSKFLVVDGAWAWVGTSNLSRDYFHGSRNLGLVVDGAAFAGRLDGLFADLWSSPYAEPVDPDRTDYQPPRRK